MSLPLAQAVQSTAATERRAGTNLRLDQHGSLKLQKVHKAGALMGIPLVRHQRHHTQNKIWKRAHGAADGFHTPYTMIHGKSH
jgi:hypothetical protein